MLWNIFKFEINYQFRKPAIHFIMGLCFFLSAFIFYMTLEYSPARLYFSNSPGSLSDFYYGQFLFILLFTAGITGNSIQRDWEYRAEEIFYTTPIRKWELLFGRFIGSYFVLVYICLGILLGTFTIYLYPEKYASKIGPFVFQNHFLPFFTIYILNTLLYGLLTFAIAILIPSQILLSIFGVIVLIISGFVEKLVTDIEYSPYLSILDPSGRAAADLDMKYWTPLDYREKYLRLENFYLLNRSVWSFISVGLFVFAYVKFSFTKNVKLDLFSLFSFKKTNFDLPNQNNLPPISSIQIRESKLFQFYTLCKSYYFQILKDFPFLILSLIGFILLAFSLYRVDSQMTFHIQALSYVVAGEVLGAVALSSYFISMFYAGELIYWEKKHNVHEINDSINIPTILIYVSKCVSLLLVILTMTLIGLVMGIITQLLKGNYEINLAVYIHTLFSFEIGYYVYMILLIFFIQSSMNHRIAGYGFITLLYLIFVLTVSKFNWLDHLYMPFISPGVTYSEMNGYGHFISRYFVVTAYWMSIALFLSVIGYLFYNRGTDDSFQSRKLEALRRWSGKARVFTFVVLLASIFLGGVIYYNTRILNKMRSPLDSEKSSASFEKKYGKYKNTVQPRVISLYSKVDLFPEKRELYVSSEMILQNKSQESISEIMVNYNEDIDFKNFQFSKSGKWILEDKELQFKIYQLEEALKTGEECRLTFDSSYAKKGFPMIGFFDSVAENGSFVGLDILLVNIGYDPSIEIKDPFKRKKYDLPERPQDPAIDDKEAQKFSLFRRDSDLVDMKFQLSTSLDQTIIAPGKLIKNWKADNRNYFLYQPEVKTDLFANIVSARYEVLRDNWNGVDLEIYYHKPHTYNIDRMMESMKDSLTLFTKEIGPYPHSFLRVLEFPRYGSFAQSFPGTIPYSESMGFIQKMKEGDLDFIYFVTAHEIAHQWWGHQLLPASVEGSNALSESLAEYYALLVVEKKYGKENIGRFTKYDMDSYLKSRSGLSEPEKPWYRTNNRYGGTLYQKGGIILYGLQYLAGNEFVSKGIRNYFEQYQNKTNPYPTTLPLLAELEKIIPADYSYYLEDSFKTVTVFDNKVVNASLATEKDGTYLVTAEIELKKFRYDLKGEETEIPIQKEAIEIGLLPETDDKTNIEIPLVVERKILSGSKLEVKLRSKQKPVYFSIDPFHILIDRDLQNNKVKL
ncbi:MAG: hypothetical protein IPO06_16080 [Leptospiraceae bacterium]|nr:hypothetical protein [Leptospiraceae bacterium]